MLIMDNKLHVWEEELDQMALSQTLFFGDVTMTSEHASLSTVLPAGETLMAFYDSSGTILVKLCLGGLQ